MAAGLQTSADLRTELREFLAQNSISLDVLGEGQDLLEIADCAERREATGCTLFRGGWITCASARQLAGRLAISLSDTGRLLDYLDIKVRRCELGCF